MKKILSYIRYIFSKMKNGIKNRLLYLMIYIYPKFWYRKKYYDEDCGGFEAFKAKRETIDKFFIVLEMAELRDEMRVLDIGCGQGQLCNLIKEKGCITFGIDFSHDAISAANKNWKGIKFVNVDALKFLPDCKFDRIFMVDFTEHVRKRYLSKLFKKCCDWMKIGGSIIIHTPEKNQELKPGIPFHPEHINLVTPKELKLMLEKAGFKIENMFVLPRYSPGYSGGIFCRATKEKEGSNKHKKEKTLIEYNATLGDTICLTGVIREYNEIYPNEELYIKSNYPELFCYSKYAKNAKENMPIKEFGKVFKLDYRALSERRNKHIVDNLAEQLGISIMPAQRRPCISIKDYEIKIFERRFILPKLKPVIIISPFSRWKTRNWVEQRWREVGQYLIDKYDAFLIQVGKENEPFLGIGSNLLGLTDVRTLAILLSKSVMFLSVDNGIHHLAASVGTPGVVLFGPVKPEYRMYQGITYPVYPEFGCRGCYHKMDWHVNNPPRFCPIGTYECMINISVDQVICAIYNLMHKLGV